MARDLYSKRSRALTPKNMITKLSCARRGRARTGGVLQRTMKVIAPTRNEAGEVFKPILVW